jgi:hypothetical protein
MPELTKTMLQLVQGLGETYIVIDALDECRNRTGHAESREMRRVALSVLSKLNDAANVHLLVTCRDGEFAEEIEYELQDWKKKLGPGYHDISLKMADINQDIEKLIDSRLRERCWRMVAEKDPEFLEEIRVKVRSGKEMYSHHLLSWIT